MNQSSKQWLEAISLVARWPDTPRRMGNSREVWVGVSGLRSFRLRVVSPTSYSPTCEVVSRTCWVSSLTAFIWSVAERRRYVQAYRTFLYHGWENEAYTCGALVSLLSGTTGLAPTWGGGGHGNHTRDRASVHTQELWFRRDFCKGEKLRCTALYRGAPHFK